MSARVSASREEAPGAGTTPLGSSESASMCSSLHCTHAVRVQHTGGHLREIWNRRELLYFLSWRDVKVRYKQTVLGVLWAVIQPLFTMALFTVVFGRFAHISSDGIPRPIFYFSALLPWLYMSSSITNASMSLVSNYQLLTKIYFPRIMLPGAVVLSSLVDFFIGSLMLVGFIVYYHVRPTWALLIWPALVVEMILLTLAISLFLAALNAKYRDVKYVVPFAVQLWMFATPLIYPMSMLPRALRRWVVLNPAAGLIEAFRHAFVASSPVQWNALAASSGITVVLFLGALAYFYRSERAFADVI